MRLLVVSQYFWPESFIINDLVRTLADQGVDVTVMTGKPNYPGGDIFPGYDEKGVVEELFEGRIRILRVPLRPRGRGVRNLMRNYLSFVLSGSRYFPGLARDMNPDVILVFGLSPITAAIPAIILRLRKHAHLAVWIQDLWPESLSATGYVRNPVLLWAVGLLVRAIYACCDTLLVQSRAFIDPVARLASKNKIVYYPNSMLDVPSNGGVSASEVPGELLELMERNFCAVFAGNIGSAQAVETLVDCAERLRDLPDFKMVMIGSGSKLDWVQAERDRRNLHNLVLPGRFPMEQMPPLLSRASALLVTLKKETIFSYTVPSKIQAYMAAGRPLVAALDGEGTRIIEEAGAGLCCPSEDVNGLEERLRRLYGMAYEDRKKMGQAGRRYFLEHFEMTKMARRLTYLLQSRIDGKSL